MIATSIRRESAERLVQENGGMPIGYRKPGKLGGAGWRIFLFVVVSLVVALVFFGSWALFLDEPQWLDELTDPIANLLAGHEGADW